MAIKPIFETTNELKQGIENLSVEDLKREITENPDLLVVDIREIQERVDLGTIPGSVNYPFTDLSKDVDDPVMVEALQDFGAKRRAGVGFFQGKMEEFGFFDGDKKTEKWDFSNVKDLVLWCNGPACGQSPRAIRGLLDVGYPGEKIRYYRGGMQMWQLWGLTTVVPRER